MALWPSIAGLGSAFLFAFTITGGKIVTRDHSVLTLLSRAANRVERPEILPRVFVSVGARHGAPHQLADREGFAGQHRCLIGDADAPKIALRIEIGRRRVRIALHQSRPAQTPFNEITHLAGLVNIANDEILAALVLLRLRRRRARLFMIMLAMNERSESIARVTLDSLPDVEHRATGRVDHHAPDLSKNLKVSDRHSEGWKNDHVVGVHSTEIDVSIVGHEEGDPHRLEFGVHMRVMDDLASQIDGTIRELLSCLIGVVDRPLHAVTEAELLC